MIRGVLVTLLKINKFYMTIIQKLRSIYFIYRQIFTLDTFQILYHKSLLIDTSIFLDVMGSVFIWYPSRR